ncbi:MAG: HesB/IscA family protein [Alphaproteobacteria bacterium]
MASKEILTVTPGALSRIQALLAARQKPALGVRLSVKTKGCSGLAYALEYVDEAREGDEVVALPDSVCLYIDTGALLFLIGSEMDYQEDALKSGFLFRNPNEKGKCGCGESFHV